MPADGDLAWCCSCVLFNGSRKGLCLRRRRTNVQQVTCNIDLSSSFYYLFLSFVLIELKPFVYKWKVLGKKFWKSAKKCENYETILPFSCCPLVFHWALSGTFWGGGAQKGAGFRKEKCEVRLWPGGAPTGPETPQNSKTYRVLP